MTLTSPEIFRAELNHLHALAQEAGYLASYAMADAAGVKRRQMHQWMGGYACPLGPWARDKVLTDICNALKLNPMRHKENTQ